MSGGAGGERGEPPADLVDRTLHLARALRNEGVAVGPGEIADALRAVEAVSLDDREGVRFALRSVLVGRREEFEAFGRLFREVWCAPTGSGPEPAEGSEGEEASDRTIPAPTLTRPGERRLLSLKGWLNRDHPADGDEEPTGIPAMSPRHGRSTKDFRAYDDEDLEALERVARRIARVLARRPGRRWKPGGKGGRVHLRRTLRRSLSTGGEIARLAYRERKPRKVRVVVLCDVSGSMELYSRFLLQFLYALRRAVGRIETFAFSTRLSRITGALAEGTYGEALDRLSREVEGWSGGTRIGASLSAFREGWGDLVDRKTAFVILSDGWDTGEPELLARELRRLRARARKVIWLNPLLGSPDYEPRTRGMEAALPHVDLFAPVHDLESLEGLARELVRAR